MLFAKRANLDERPRQNGVLLGMEWLASLAFVLGAHSEVSLFVAGVDGSLASVIPVREAVYKRLQLLERQVTRHIQHALGLNPRAFRYVNRLVCVFFHVFITSWDVQGREE
jgi:hypothetical protein